MRMRVLASPPHQPTICDSPPGVASIAGADSLQVRNGENLSSGCLEKSRPKCTDGRSKVASKCQVCGEGANGNFFGATVCLPCKTFFIRCSSEEKMVFRCRKNSSCEVLGSNRARCKHCRYQKCLNVGMERKERPEQVHAVEGQQLCVVCGDVANGIHFGVVSCEGCKKFFRRGLQESDSYVCKNKGDCVVNPKTRNECRYCRFLKCISVGMSREAIRMGRPRKHSIDLFCPSTPWTQDNLGQGSCFSPTSLPEIRHPFTEKRPMVPFHPYSDPRMYRYPILRETLIPNGEGLSSPQSPYPVQDRTQVPAVTIRSSAPFQNQTDISAPQRMLSASTNYHPVSPDESFIRKSVESRNRLRPSSSSSGYASDISVEDTESDLSPIDFSVANGGNNRPPTYYVLTDDRSNGNLNAKCSNNYHCDKDRRTIPVEVEDRKVVDNQDNSSDVRAISEHAQSSKPSARECELSGVRNRKYHHHTFEESYWLKPPTKQLQGHNLSVFHKAYAGQIVAAYNCFLEGFCQKVNNETEDLPLDEVLKTQILRQLSEVIGFVRILPGFTDITPEDQYTIFRLGGIQCAILAASLHLYDCEKETFVRNFYEQDLPVSNPQYFFRAALLDYAKSIESLHIDLPEAAFLAALIIFASDWPQLVDSDPLEQTRHHLLTVLEAYTLEKYGSSSCRIQQLFSHVPKLRQLGMWHYKITFEL